MEPEVESPVPSCASEQPALDKLDNSRVQPGEGNGKPFLHILYLENPSKGRHKLKLPGWHTIATNMFCDTDDVFCW